MFCRTPQLKDSSSSKEVKSTMVMRKYAYESDKLSGC